MAANDDIRRLFAIDEIRTIFISSKNGLVNMFVKYESDDGNHTQTLKENWPVSLTPDQARVLAIALIEQAVDASEQIIKAVVDS